MGFFSSDVFLQTAARAFFPGRPSTIERVCVQGRYYRVLFVGRRVAADLPFLDYLEPCEPGAVARSVGFLPRVVRARTLASEWAALQGVAGVTAAPYIDWSTVAAWEDFIGAAIRRLCIDVGRKSRKLRRELGELRFLPDEPDPQLLDQLMAWKSAQYRASGLADHFRDDAVRALFSLLLRDGVLRLSTLRAGDRLIAAHAGVEHNGSFLYWLPAYDPCLASASVGTLHLLEMLRHSREAGHARFDFLLGAERYKWAYATHFASIGPVGAPSLVRRVYAAGRERFMAPVRRAPRAYAALQATKRLLVERGWLR